jgi:hypothetical protein
MNSISQKYLYEYMYIVCVQHQSAACMVLYIIIIILVITFMQGIYNYIPETNRVSRVYSVAAILYLQLVQHVILFCLCSMFFVVVWHVIKMCIF